MNKIAIPEGMLKAAMDAGDPSSLLIIPHRRMLEAAVRWLSENPIVPTDDQMLKLYEDMSVINDGHFTFRTVVEWQRRMFVVQESEIRKFVIDGADRFRGCTLTPQEWEYIQEAVGRSVHPVGIQSDETTKRPEAPEVMYIMRHFDDIGMDEKELLNRARAAVSDTVAHFARAEKIKPIDLEER